MTTKYAALNDNVYFWFGLNALTGGGDDGASPTFAVRLGGAASTDAPIYSGTPTLLTDAGYTPGSYEIAIAATAGNGFAASNQYGVFSSALVSSVNPTGFVGALNLSPILSNVTQLGSDAQSATDLKDFADAGYDPATNKVQGVVLVDSTTEIAANGITATSLSSGAMTDIYVAVWDAPLAGFTTPGTAGDTLSNAGAGTDPWATALPGAYSIGEAGYILGTNLDALISSRMATYTQPTGFLAATFPTTVASTTNITAGTITTATNVTTISANGITNTSFSTGALTDIQGTVWNADLSLYQDAGSTGEALGVAGTGGDPWSTILPGAYTIGMAGYTLGTNLNATISSVNDNINGVQQATIIRDAVNVLQFPMYLSGTDDDPATGKTVTAQVSDETGAYGPCTGTVTEIGLGAYAFTTSVADAATPSGSYMFSATGCKNTLYPFKTSE
jgi:hypothetical protein